MSKVIYAMSVSLDGSTAINALKPNGPRVPNNTR
jgi:hypothetical protein